MGIDYTTPGVFTDLRALDPDLLPGTLSVIETCALVPGLIVEPDDAASAGVAASRMEERNLRPAQDILSQLLALRDEPLHCQREPACRVVGTCRHFAIVACALLRHQGLASRVRCGFATYFQPERAVDHWIVEHHDRQRWVRIDPEILGGTVIDRAHDLAAPDFLSGAEAWAAHRTGAVAAETFGVYGTENWGVGEIRGNLVRDLAALNKIEVLPWDDWGKMDAGYDDTAGPAYDDLLDRCAQACNDDDLGAIAELLDSPDLRVPDAVIGASC